MDTGTDPFLAVGILIILMICVVLFVCGVALAILLLAIAGTILLGGIFLLSTGAAITGKSIRTGVVLFAIQLGLLAGLILGAGLGFAVSYSQDLPLWNNYLTLPLVLICGGLSSVLSYTAASLWYKIAIKTWAWGVARFKKATGAEDKATMRIKQPVAEIAAKQTN